MEDMTGLTANEQAEKIIGYSTNQCPSCKVKIEKNGGCDHMTCKCAIYLGSSSQNLIVIGRCGHNFQWQDPKKVTLRRTKRQ